MGLLFFILKASFLKLHGFQKCAQLKERHSRGPRLKSWRTLTLQRVRIQRLCLTKSDLVQVGWAFMSRV